MQQTDELYLAQPVCLSQIFRSLYIWGFCMVLQAQAAHMHIYKGFSLFFLFKKIPHRNCYPSHHFLILYTKEYHKNHFKALFPTIWILLPLNKDFSCPVLLIAIKTCYQVSWLTLPNPYLTTLLNIMTFKGTFSGFLTDSLGTTGHNPRFLFLSSLGGKDSELIKTSFQT